MPALPSGFPGRAVAVASCLVGTLLGCGTVDLGTQPADVNACRPSQEFFVQRIWPEFLTKDYGGKRCGDARCHDASSGRALVLVPPTSPVTFPLPADWAAVYKSVTEQLQCTNVSGSTLLTRPDGRQTHGGGKLIEPNGLEAMLVRMWIEAP